MLLLFLPADRDKIKELLPSLKKQHNFHRLCTLHSEPKKSLFEKITVVSVWGSCVGTPTAVRLL